MKPVNTESAPEEMTSPKGGNPERLQGIRFLWLYHLMVPAMRLVLRLVNKTIRSLSPDPTFFDPANFSWTREVEAYFPDIRRECLEVIADLNQVPNLDELSEGSSKLAQGDEWKGFLLMAFGRVAPRNASRCPKTVEAMKRIPGINTVAFSVLGPRVHLPRHTGEFAGILRYHMGVLLPDGSDCRIGVDDEVRTWTEGGSMIFDDTHPHEVWNDTDQIRVVLLADFVRPGFWPIRMLVRGLIAAVSRTSYTTDVIRNAEEWKPRTSEQPSDSG